jgi:TM2 domain-containing membrane protein YozV
MIIKQNSWHYKLAKFSGLYMYKGMKTNFCSYFWSVVLGICKILLCVLGILIACLLIGGGYYELYMWYFHDVKMSEGAITIVIISTSIPVVLGLAWALVKYLDYRDERKSEYVKKEPTFMSLAYQKFKNKTCVKVEIE